MRAIKGLFSLVLFILALSLFGCGGGGGDNGGGSSNNTSSTTLSPAGAVANPITLTFPGSFTYADSVAIDKFGKYFKVTGLTAGQDYKLSLSSAKPVRLNAYNFKDFTSRSCQSTSYCIISGDVQGEAYIEIEWYSISGADLSYSFSLSMSLTNFEGSITAPKNLTGLLPYNNTISASLSGYYFVSNLTAGNNYTFKLVLPTGSDSDLYAYQDAFNSQACASTFTTNGRDESCTFTAAGSTAWIKIRANEGGSFDLTLTNNGVGRSYVSSGSIGAEVELTLDNYSFSSRVDYTSSYYHISGLDPTQKYRTVASLSWYLDNIDLYVYSDSNYTNLLCASNTVAIKDEVCLTSSSASGELWIKVDGTKAHTELGANYFLTTYSYFPNEGTSSARVQLNYPANTPMYSGSVDTKSYYTINGLEAGKSYVVDVNNISHNLTDVTVGGANPVDYFTPDCEVPYSDIATSVVNLTCIAEAKADGTLSLNIESYYSGSDNTSSTFDISVSLSLYQSDGDIAAPANFALGSSLLPHSTSIGGASNYYAISGLTANQAYTISIDGTPSHPLVVYTTNPNISINKACYDGYPPTGSTISQCTVRTVGDTLWVKVSDTNMGGVFTLNAIHAPYQSEGSIATPVQIPLGADPVQGVSRSSMVSVDNSYYQLTGLTVGQDYAIAIRNIDSEYNHELYVYDNVSVFGSSVYSDYACYKLNISSHWGDGYCMVNATDTSLWIRVEGNIDAVGGRFNLTAQVQPVNETLTLDYSVSSTFPRTSSADLTNSTYTITGLTPNELYDVTLSNMTDTVIFGFCSSQTGTTNKSCIKAADTNGQIFVTVNSSAALYGAHYTLGITAGNINEGTATSPFALDFNTAFPYSGQVGTGESFYKATGLLANTLYEVHLTNQTDQLGLKVYDAANFSLAKCRSLNTNVTNKVCGGMSTANGELFISVYAGYSVLGANFNLNLVQGHRQEGSIGAEVALVYGTADLPHASSVDLTNSYYEISGLSGGTNYMIELNSLTGSAELRVYQDSAQSAFECIAGNNGVSAACTARTKNGGSASLFLHVLGGSTVIGAQYNVNVLTPTVNEGTMTTPDVLDYNAVNVTPYAGQVASAKLADAYSYYRLDNLNVGSNYTLSMVTQQDHAAMNVYTSATDLNNSVSTCYAQSAGVGNPQVCTVTAADTSMWIRIGNPLNSSRIGTYFTLSTTL